MPRMLSEAVAPNKVISGPNTDSKPAMTRSLAMSIPGASRYTMLMPGSVRLSAAANSTDFSNALWPNMPSTWATANSRPRIAIKATSFIDSLTPSRPTTPAQDVATTRAFGHWVRVWSTRSPKGWPIEALMITRSQSWLSTPSATSRHSMIARCGLAMRTLAEKNSSIW